MRTVGMPVCGLERALHIRELVVWGKVKPVGLC